MNPTAAKSIVPDFAKNTPERPLPRNEQNRLPRGAGVFVHTFAQKCASRANFTT